MPRMISTETLKLRAPRSLPLINSPLSSSPLQVVFVLLSSWVWQRKKASRQGISPWDEWMIHDCVLEKLLKGKKKTTTRTTVFHIEGRKGGGLDMDGNGATGEERESANQPSFHFFTAKKPEWNPLFLSLSLCGCLSIRTNTGCYARILKQSEIWHIR